MTETRSDPSASIIDRSSITFDYDNYVLSMLEERQSTDHSSASEDHVKTDYRLSLPSSSQIHSYHLNHANPAISERRKKFLSRIITIVAVFLLVVCILLVTLTLRLAHKIDELVRLKQLMPKPNTFLLFSTATTTTATTTTNIQSSLASPSSLSTTTAAAAMNHLLYRRRTPSSFLTSFLR